MVMMMVMEEEDEENDDDNEIGGDHFLLSASVTFLVELLILFITVIVGLIFYFGTLTIIKSFESHQSENNSHSSYEKDNCTDKCVEQVGCD